MNPQSATIPSPPIAPAAPAPAPAAPPAAEFNQSGPSIVNNIPVHTAQAVSKPTEDTELDKIMQDVGHVLKKQDQKPQKHGLLDFLHHDPKPLVKVNNQAANQPVGAPMPVDVQVAPSMAQAVPVATMVPAADMTQASVMPQLQPQAGTAPAKLKTQNHVPVFIIFVALCVTGFLVAAAIAAYRTQN